MGKTTGVMMESRVITRDHNMDKGITIFMMMMLMTRIMTLEGWQDENIFINSLPTCSPLYSIRFFCS